MSYTEPDVGVFALGVSACRVLLWCCVPKSNADIVKRYGQIMFRAVACGVLCYSAIGKSLCT
jgi:hypothetical protein